MQLAKPVDTQNLQVFVTTADERNMSNAAKKLGLTQSAVSQSIRQLEDQFGVVLFNRERRPLTLTSAGLALHRRSVELLEEVSHLSALVINASRGVKPDLRVGLVDSFAATVGLEFIQQLLAQSSTLSVKTGLSPYHGAALIARDLDLIVTSEPLMDFDNISRHRLLSEKFIVITPCSRSLIARSVSDLKHLSDTLPMVRFNRQSHLGAQIERFLRRMDIKLPYKLETDRADTVTSLVASGLGWAITTPLCLLQGAEYAGKINIHYLSDSQSDRSLYLIGRQDEYAQLLNYCFTETRDMLSCTLRQRLDVIDPKLHTMVDIPTDIQAQK
jgi:DNA-binding transcriptional LysR family regulator